MIYIFSVVRKTIKDLEIQLEDHSTKIGMVTEVLGLSHTEMVLNIL